MFIKIKKMIILKKHFSLLFMLSALVLIFTQCSTVGEQHAQYIPNEALAVAAVDLKKLYSKANFQQIKNSTGFKQWKASMEEENELFNDLFLANLNDPLASGINFGKKVFVYTYSGGGLFSSNTGIIAAMSNQAKFENTLKQTNKKLKIQASENGYKFAEIGKHEAVGWNKNVIIYISPQSDNKKSDRPSARSYLTGFFTLEKSNSLISNKNFRSFLGKPNDVAVWYSLDAAKKTMTAALKFYRYSRNDQKILDEILNFSNSYIHYDLNFKRGKVVFSSRYHLNKRLQKFHKETHGKNLNSKLLSQMSQKNLLGFVGLAWNFKGIYDWLKRVEGFEQEFDKNAQKAGLSPDDLLEALQGELMMTVTGFEKFKIREKGSRYGDYLTNMLEKHDVDEKKLAEFRERLGKIPDKIRISYAPEVTAILSFKNAKVTTHLMNSLAERFSFETVKNQTYHQIKLAKLPVYLGIRKNQMILSNQEKIIQQMLAPSPATVTSSALNKEATQYTSYAYLNLNFDKYSKNTQKNLKEQLGAQFGKLQEGLSLFEDLKAQSKDFSAQMVLTLSNKKDNSLETILNTLLNGVSLITMAD